MTSLQVGEWKTMKSKVSRGRVVEVTDELGRVSSADDGAWG